MFVCAEETACGPILVIITPFFIVNKNKNAIFGKLNAANLREFECRWAGVLIELYGIKKEGMRPIAPFSKCDLERIRTFIVRTGILYSIH